MKSFKEFLINEAGLARIWDNTQKHHCGAISGYRGDNKPSENKSNNRYIKAYLLTKGYGVTSIDGTYIENFKSENEVEVKEPSFFVVDLQDTGKLERELEVLGVRFDQDSIMSIPKGGKGAYLLGTSTRDDAFPSKGEKITVGSGKFGKTSGEFLSKIKGRNFAFESVEMPKTINGIRGWKILHDEIENS